MDVSPEYHEATTGTTTFQASASGQRPGLEESNPALVLILVQGADQLQQIQLPGCRVPQKQENLELAMRKPQRQTPTRKAATRRRPEVQIGILALGVLEFFWRRPSARRRFAQLRCWAHATHPAQWQGSYHSQRIT